MDPLYTRAAATASRLLTKYNQCEKPDGSPGYELTRIATPVKNPGSPWEQPTPGADQTWPLHGIGKNKLIQFTDGNGVIHQASEQLFAAFADTIQPGDVLTKNGETLTVLDVKPVTDAPGIGWKVIIKG